MTTSRIDFELAARVGLQSLTSWAHGGSQRGDQYWMPNPLKQEDRRPDSFSINTETGVWKNFVDDTGGGDAVSLYAYLHKCGQAEAAKEILRRWGTVELPPKQEPKAEWTPIVPIPPDAKPHNFRHSAYGMPTNVWQYSRPNEAGEPIPEFYIARYEVEGRKEILPWSWCQHPDYKDEQWRMKKPKAPWPVLNGHLLAKNPRANVLIVEGETCMEAAQEMLPGWVVLTWSSGTGNATRTDWSILQGRTVWIWPDADQKRDQTTGQLLPPEKQPGMKAALEIASQLDKTNSVNVITPPTGMKDGWDIKDAVEEGWNEQRILAIIHAKPDEEKTDTPYQALGFDHDLHFFRSGRTGQMLQFTGSHLKKSHLLTLAPLEYWENEFPNMKETGIAWDNAIDFVLGQSQRAGVYDLARIRGRGAWWDNRKLVLHLGDRLIVDGEETRLTDLESRYLYERRSKMQSPASHTASTDDTRTLMRMIRGFQWETAIDADFLAGWCVVAPVCGALSWRPHLWLSGPVGSGKTYLQEQVIQPLLGPHAIAVMGDSSEAGIRQKLNGDAMPVMIDEAESNDQSQRDATKRLIIMARQASSDRESANTTLRGTISGKHQEFKIRSCFMFASKGIGITDPADMGRVTVVNLRIDNTGERETRWRALDEKCRNLMTDQFCQSIRARTIANISKIRTNAETFTRAASVVFKSQRAGDQMGILLAGAYSLEHDDVITEDAARKWLEARASALADQQLNHSHKDEQACLETLLGHTIRLTDDGKQVEATLGELISVSWARPVVLGGEEQPALKMGPAEAEKILRRYGLRVNATEDILCVASNHDKLREIFSRTAWMTNYASQLRRLNFAHSGPQMRFSAGILKYTTLMPLKSIFDDPVEK